MKSSTPKVVLILKISAEIILVRILYDMTLDLIANATILMTSVPALLQIVIKQKTTS